MLAKKTNWAFCPHPLQVDTGWGCVDSPQMARPLERTAHQSFAFLLGLEWRQYDVSVEGVTMVNAHFQTLRRQIRILSGRIYLNFTVRMSVRHSRITYVELSPWTFTVLGPGFQGNL